MMWEPFRMRVGCVETAGVWRVKLQQVTSIRTPPGLLTQRLV